MGKKASGLCASFEDLHPTDKLDELIEMAVKGCDLMIESTETSNAKALFYAYMRDYLLEKMTSQWYLAYKAAEDCPFKESNLRVPNE